ncbi:MAG: hypothetical protein ACMUEM_01995 [Flavobacteriales bacterium AspAUS03]
MKRLSLPTLTAINSIALGQSSNVGINNMSSKETLEINDIFRI